MEERQDRLRRCLWLISTCGGSDGSGDPATGSGTGPGTNNVSANTKNNSQIQLDTLITHVADSVAASNPEIKISVVKDFLIEFIPQWDSRPEQVHPRIISFILKLISTITRDEQLFTEMHQYNIYDAVFVRYNLLEENNPSIKLALVNILMSLSDYDKGIDWIMKRGYCLSVVKLCQQNKTIYFEREGHKFLSRFVWQLNKMKRIEDCENVLKSIMSPIIDHQWQSTTIINEEENSQMETILLPALNMMIEIMSNVKYYGNSNILFDIVSKKFNTDWHLCCLMQLSRSPSVLTALSKLALLCQVSKISLRKDQFKKEDLIEMRLIHVNIMSTLLSKRYIETILDFAYFTLVFHGQALREYDINFVIEKTNGTSVELTDQVVIMGILPLLTTVKLIKSDFIHLFTEKLINMMCEYTTRVAYSYRDLIKERNSHSDVVKAIQRTVIYRKYFSKSQRILVFQALYYKLQDYNPLFGGSDVTEYELINADSWEAKNLISSLLDCVYIFIDEYDIPWTDSIEVLCVYGYCIRVINTNLDPKLTVKAFKLAQLTIKKFLSPNLALLVSSAAGSILEDIGKNIYGKLHDPIWDVRDSALELLYVVTDIADIKFPPFQQQLIDNELPELVMIIAKEDSELYVRASALKCIGIMVQIQSIWEKYLQFFNLTNKMMKVLQEESEGLVRKEAALVITNIYEHQKFPEASLDNVFVMMFHAAVYDLHWEVQLTALNFWKLVIANQKSHQGMIDGIFPSVTFSKENRKIVQLNEIEINKRVKKILNELALRGCLGVLLSCMKDDNDIEVKEGALLIIEDVNNLLIKYNVTDLSTINDNDVPSLKSIFNETFLKNHENLSNIGKLRNKADIRNESNNIILDNTNNDHNSESVIDSIVNADDFNLLANVYANQMNVNTSDSSSEEVFTYKGDHKYLSDMFVEPQTFLQTIKSANFRAAVNESRRWRLNLSDSIDSLFNDIISANKQSDVNDLDCY